MFRTICAAALTCGSLYFVALGLLVSFPALQTHAFYLHRVTLTWFKDLDVPEQFGFAHRQVNSFYIGKNNTHRLHAWHVLPIGTYRRNINRLLNDFEEQVATTQLDLLQSDPDARLVVYLHGTAGTLASGWRPDSYRALYAAAPDHIHVITFDYSGFGLSSGSPSEQGLLEDAISVVEWALHVAKLPASRIAIYGQSLGTGVAFALMEHYATLPEPLFFAGHVLTASFSDVATLTATYRIGGVIPVLSPLRRIPPLLAFFNSFLTSTWMSKDRLAGYIRVRERSTQQTWPYYINLIHAEDDSDITCEHSNVLFWHAVNASTPQGITFEALRDRKRNLQKTFGPGGWMMQHDTNRGTIRQTMLMYGVHDKLMSYPVTSLAVIEAFQAATPDFMK